MRQVLAEEEVEEFAGHASVLLVNVGTLTPPSLAAMKAAAAAYARLGKPWVLDPVAAGAAKYRMQVGVQSFLCAATVWSLFLLAQVRQ